MPVNLQINQENFAMEAKELFAQLTIMPEDIADQKGFLIIVNINKHTATEIVQKLEETMISNVLKILMVVQDVSLTRVTQLTPKLLLNREVNP